MNNTTIAKNYCKEIKESIELYGGIKISFQEVLKAKATQHKEDCERFLKIMQIMKWKRITKTDVGLDKLIKIEEDLTDAIKIYKENGI